MTCNEGWNGKWNNTRIALQMQANEIGRFVAAYAQSQTQFSREHWNDDMKWGEKKYETKVSKVLRSHFLFAWNKCAFFGRYFSFSFFNSLIHSFFNSVFLSLSISVSFDLHTPKCINEWNWMEWNEMNFTTLRFRISHACTRCESLRIYLHSHHQRLTQSARFSCSQFSFSPNRKISLQFYYSSL